MSAYVVVLVFFFQAEDGIRDADVTGVQTCALPIAQTLHIRGAIIVTTPQEVSVGDALRGAKMFERVGVPVIGVVENMSYFVCPHCGERTEVFLTGGGARLAQELGVPLLGQVPLQA